MKILKTFFSIKSRRRAFIATFSISIYLIIFLFLSGFDRTGKGMSAVIPVVIIAWFYGYKAGIIAALISFPLNILMYEITGTDWAAKMTGNGGGIAGTAALLFIGGVVGYMSYLNTLLQKKNEQINKEIIERKKLEEEKQQKKEFFLNVFESSRDAMVITDVQGTIQLVNTATEEMSGFKREELIGEHISLFSAGDKKLSERVVEKIAEMFETGSSFYESKLKTKEGTILDVECSCSVIIGNKDLIAAMGIVRDVTEKKSLETRLHQSEKLKSLGELAGGVAHDFNNVLAAILGRVQLLKQYLDPPPGIEEKRKSALELKEELDVIEQAARDGAETVKRIQTFARRENDDRHYDTVDINKILDHALDYTKIRWKNNADLKGIQYNIHKNLSPLPLIKGRAAELREVFTNMINNALDAMPQGGDITIGTNAEDNQLVITLGDTGSGIPQSVQSRIFDPFVTSKGNQSTGLGLSVSYGIIKRHNGSITVDSRESQGTIFTIRLPVSKEEHKEERKTERIEEQQRKARILVIDDEEKVRSSLVAILRQYGHEVVDASNGKEGIKLFNEKEFDLVLTDLGMPEMTGWQIAENIKGINGRVPVGVITGWNVEISESEMKDKWVDLIIQKPFEVTQVLELVHDGLILRDQFKAA